MNSKNSLSITEARKKIFTIAEEVQKPGIYYTLTEKGRAKVVIMSADEYDSWQETMEIMSDREAIQAIYESEKNLKTGRVDQFVPWKEAQKKLSLTLHDKDERKYLPHRHRKKSAKTTRKNR